MRKLSSLRHDCNQSEKFLQYPRSNIAGSVCVCVLFFFFRRLESRRTRLLHEQIQSGETTVKPWTENVKAPQACKAPMAFAGTRPGKASQGQARDSSPQRQRDAPQPGMT